jgi:hypothetical protein
VVAKAPDSSRYRIEYGGAGLTSGDGMEASRRKEVITGGRKMIFEEEG